MLEVALFFIGSAGGATASALIAAKFVAELDAENKDLASRLVDAGLELTRLRDLLSAGGRAKAAKARALVRERAAQIQSEIAGRKPSTTARKGSN